MSKRSLTRGEVDGLDDLHTPGGVVAHVVVVVDLAVEELDADVDAVVLGDFLDAVETGDGIFWRPPRRTCLRDCRKKVMTLGTPALAASGMYFAGNLPQSWA